MRLGAGAAARHRCCVRLGAWGALVLVPLQGAAAVCTWRLRGLVLVPLLRVLGRLGAGASAGCRCLGAWVLLVSLRATAVSA